MNRNAGFRSIRRDELRTPSVEDSYRAARKPAGPARCPDCGVVYVAGRWSWDESPPGAREQRCPACQRTRDAYPAGYVSLSGEFLARHRDEVMNRVRNCETAERERHPLERIMSTDDANGRVLITTTGVHLARRIGDALHDAFKGELEFRYHDGEQRLRVHWQR